MSSTPVAIPQIPESVVESYDPKPDESLRMTYEEYLAWAGEDVRAEWVDGEVIIDMPPKTLHQRLTRFLLYVLHTFVQYFDQGEVIEAPFEVRLWPDGPSREPDVIFVAHTNSEQPSPERLSGAPDLVIEIVSTESVQRDRIEKFDEYERAGVREYWVIDNRPEVRRAWFYRLGEHGQFERVIVGEDGIYRSAVLEGFWLRLEWLWAESPDVLRAVAEVIGPEQIAEALRRSLED